ncbi:MAG TPA: DUF6798 domain-containing protein [Pirellulales bacterium]|nr:DUF6798 domain-containing protein [Pirellulales bacterium]
MANSTPAIDTSPLHSALPGWQALAEIALVFVVFFLHGAWPVPDVNENDYVIKAVHFWNHDAFAHDFFVNSGDAHVVYYWAFGWLSTLGFSLDAMTWIGRIVTWLLLAIAWRGLSHQLLPRPWLAVLSAELFTLLIEHAHAGGEWMIGGVEGKGFAWALLLWALHALVCGRWNLAWLLLGAATSLHAIVGGWGGVCVAVVWLLSGRERPSLLGMLPGLIGSFLLALPGLWFCVVLNQGADWQTIQQANSIQVFERLPHHLYPAAFSAVRTGRHVLLWIAFALLCRVTPAAESERRLRRFVAAGIFLAMIGFVLSWTAAFAPHFAASLLRFYWSRMSDVLTPLGVTLVGIKFAGEQLRGRKMAARWLYMGLLVLLAFDLFKQVSHQPWLPSPVPSRSDSVMVYNDWRDVCRWIAADEHTPPDAVFITPRNSNTFKWYTGRSEVVTWKDMPQDARSIVQWWQRINDLYATESQEPGDRWRTSVAEMGEAPLHELAKKYGAQYAVVERAPDLPWLGMQPLYENKSYAVYRFDLQP